MKSNLIYWDSCVWIDWINGKEGKNPERIPAIQSVFKVVDNGYYRLMVTTLYELEVLESKMPSTSIIKFHDFMKNIEKVKLITPSTAITEKAKDIKKRVTKKISTRDTIHLATAIIMKARVLHTFDSHLLKLDRKSEVDGLNITECTIPGANYPLF